MSSNLLESFSPNSDMFATEWLEEWNVDGVQLKSFRITTNIIDGEPVRTYCIIGRPVNTGQSPAILHVHGGGGTVSEEDVVYYVKRGYVCLSLDWTGPTADRPYNKVTHYPKTFHPSDREIYDDSDTSNMQIACAVKAARCCLKFLDECEYVDSKRIGFFGISWGGFAAWLINGTDTTAACAVSIYGTGGLHRPRHFFNEFWLQATDQQKKDWMRTIEPMGYASKQNAPILHINGTNDFFGGFDTAAEMLPMLSSDWSCDFTPNSNHHYDHCGDILLDAWFDYYLKDAPAIPAAPFASIERVIPGTIRVRTNDTCRNKTLWFSYQATWSRIRSWRHINEWKSDEEGFYIDFPDCIGEIWLFIREFHPDREFSVSSTPLCVHGEGRAIKKSTVVFNPPELCDGWGEGGYNERGPKDPRYKLSDDCLEITMDGNSFSGLIFHGCSDPFFQADNDAEHLLIELEGIEKLTLTCSHRELSRQSTQYKLELDNIIDSVISISREMLIDQDKNNPDSFADIASIAFSGEKRIDERAVIKKIYWK